MLTSDQLDYIIWTRIFQRERRPHHGVLILGWQPRKAQFTRCVDALVRCAAAHPDGLPAYTCEWAAYREWMEPTAGEPKPE